MRLPSSTVSETTAAVREMRAMNRPVRRSRTDSVRLGHAPGAERAGFSGGRAIAELARTA